MQAICLKEVVLITEVFANLLFMLWFNFSLGVNFIFLLIVFNKLNIIHVHYYHTTKQRKMKFTPRIKLNHNIYNIAHSLPTTHDYSPL